MKSREIGMKSGICKLLVRLPCGFPCFFTHLRGGFSRTGWVMMGFFLSQTLMPVSMRGRCAGARIFSGSGWPGETRDGCGEGRLWVRPERRKPYKLRGFITGGARDDGRFFMAHRLFVLMFAWMGGRWASAFFLWALWGGRGARVGMGGPKALSLPAAIPALPWPSRARKNARACPPTSHTHWHHRLRLKKSHYHPSRS